MAIRIVCDGCACELTDEQAVAQGRLDPVAYCPTCAASWAAYEAVERAKRIELVSAFEAWRIETLAALKKNGLAKLPDE